MTRGATFQKLIGYAVLGVFLSLFVCASSIDTAYSAEPVSVLKGKARNYYYGLKGDKNLAKAFRLYLQAAQLGDPEAKFIAGGMYYKGLGTTRDYTRAFMLLHDAAKQGFSSPESELIIAQGFFVGSEVPRNYDEALKWYKKAADGNNNEALNELGYLYYLGQGVEQDVNKGADFFKRAAMNDMVTGQYNYGMVCYSGNGVETQDLGTAYAWMSIAAAKGYQPAISARDYIEQLLSDSELKQAQTKAESLRKEILRTTSQ